jgi:O-antigen/teichoic acid export membrane protein
VKTIVTSHHFLALAGNVLASATGFISILLLARIITPQDLGAWLLYLTAFTFADMLRSGIIHTAFIRHYSEERNQPFSGAAWVIGGLLSGILGLMIFLVGQFFPDFLPSTGFSPFSRYLPWLMIASLPFTLALWILQAENRFGQILSLRVLLTLPFFLFICSGLYYPIRAGQLVQVHVFCYASVSLIAIFMGWTNIRSVFRVTTAAIRTVLGFGKYSFGTLLCSNLLRSSDAFMIQWFIGPGAVAVYQLPYKLIELVEIPLRSFVATALPRLSRLSQQSNFTGIRYVFTQRVGVLTLALLPGVLILLIFADWIVDMVGGDQYGSSTGIFRALLIYSIFLPLDRFIGVTLDCINQPQLNLLKTVLMLLINIAGNWLVLSLSAPLFLVAATTLVSTLGGILFGAWLLRPFVPFSSRDILQEGFLCIHRNLTLNRSGML